MSTPERNRRPAESAFKQQKLKAWQPILSPKWVISSFLAVGVVFIAIGIPVLMASNQVLSVSVRYDELCMDQAVCKIEFDLSDDDGWEDQDVYVYYQLDNFYQNHRRYVQSRAAKQLTGETLKLDSTDVLTSDGSVAECSPFFDHSVDKTDGEDNEVYMYPCGLVARSFFNDSFILRGPDDAIVQYNDHDGNKACTARTAPLPCPSNPEGIAWQSDVDKKYKAAEVPWLKRNCKYIGGMNLNYSGFTHPDMATIQTRATTSCDGPEFCGLRVLQDDGVTPNNGIYNCWHNVSDQDFIVWMRIAALPSFKKLYRKIPKGTLTKNSKYTFEIHNNFPVHQFKGKKHVVLSTTTWIGGQNDFLGYSYVVVGGICVVLALLFLGKHMVSPRIMGDTKYLQWK
eukprot:CAMPEP_0202854662 /NCGR_PEP_ID=MMETSP1389-20130828/91119_1 /ASSEMBLY_ACC=CAM_ASM_000865 /TAXON_ID=302021 /ORGANISM="Rhodomonas sp., Strain CCMP768" /LENGTH=397 /DNA_ID=CAMNT_0049533259 /DNA_START=28 /DNA_END=1221 /DNA_ORIENTATION=-